MVLDKLKEALEEIAVERRKLDATEAKLRAMIAEYSGMDAPTFATVSVSRPSREKRTQLDIVADILRMAGKPLHINDIVSKMSEVSGQAINRNQVEPGVTRHIAHVKQPIIAKFGPSTYGLPEWKEMQPTLAHIA